MSRLRIALIFGGFVTAVAAAFYPIFFYPLAHKNEYSKYVQRVNRTGINQADVQPVGKHIDLCDWCGTILQLHTFSPLQLYNLSIFFF
uniref:Small integral membrane protein 20 n=1 Tax=Mola mola TaxID=94237 RepID=A0A3Q4BD27_MOLML